MARILVVDDSQTLLDLYQEILSDEGYTVDLHAGPPLDPAGVAQHAADLIILDYIFGHEASGLALVQRLLLSPATARIPILICTAATDLIAAVQPKLDRLGIVVLPKPFQINDLLDAVDLALHTAVPGTRLPVPRQPPVQ